MISAKTRYKTHDGELVAIVETFKTWRHYLEHCKHKFLVLTDHNNLQQFMDTKSLSFYQVRWALELSCYHFRINYCQGKANRAADALSRFLQQDDEEKVNFQAENTQILYCLQFLLTSVSISGLNTRFSGLPPQLQVFIYRIYALP